MWWWQAAEWNTKTDRCIILKGRMHKSVLDYNKPTKRREGEMYTQGRQCWQGSGRFLALHWLNFKTSSCSWNSLNTLCRTGLCHQRQLPPTEQLRGCLSHKYFSLYQISTCWGHMWNIMYETHPLSEIQKNDSSERLKMQWDSFP